VISWSESKNEILKAERGISFEEVCAEIDAGRTLDVIDHPSRAKQEIYIVRLHG